MPGNAQGVDEWLQQMGLIHWLFPNHILYGSGYPHQPDVVLKANLQRQKQILASLPVFPYLCILINKNITI